ncbi:MAG: protein kinase, partial [Deltaproteobacteria bacterium]|nr:protein kinase [Deltaproteobacteria bacterium]
MGEQIFGGKYRSESLIFEDKLGKVFKGTDTESGSVVFITAFDPRMNVTDEKANRVLKTNLELSELLAPQILIGLDAGCEGENRFIAAEGCEFAPLKSLIKAGNGLQPADALGIAYQICSALRNAAGAGINHLDLNSQNIFVDGDRAGGFRIRIARYGFSELVPPYSAGKKNDL